MTVKHLVLGENANTWYAVGPVYGDEMIDRIREAIEARGDTNRGTVPVITWEQYRSGGGFGGGQS